MLRFLVFFFAVAAFSFCRKADPPPPNTGEPTAFLLKIPTGFPQPDIPADNALTTDRVELGRRLFYDPILSADSSRSCASCHAAHLAFSDSTAVSLGIENRAGTRNSPSLANVVYQKKLLREGGVPTLEMQIQVPIQEHNEFDFNILLVVERLEKSPFYVDLAQKAYARQPDAFVLTRAIAAFERTFLSGESRFDEWFYQKKAAALTASEKRGFELFESEKLGCAGCHEGFLFTNQAFSNNGLYENYPDSGRIRLTGLEADRAVFKVPSLRNVALTAPFMHDGSLATLEAVVDHYENGLQPHPNRGDLIRVFSLTATERADLLAFLRSLTDEKFVQNPAFQK